MKNQEQGKGLTYNPNFNEPHPGIEDNFLVEINGQKFWKVGKALGNIPDMPELSAEMWKIWERPGLAKRDRSIAIIAMIIALGTATQMGVHLQYGMDNGLTKEEIGEIIILMAQYCGWPRGATAAGVFADLVGEE
jgi:4-carboxymuconolactone decarboxylase